jgi:hypothetical protein
LRRFGTQKPPKSPEIARNSTVLRHFLYVKNRYSDPPMLAAGLSNATVLVRAKNIDFLYIKTSI